MLNIYKKTSFKKSLVTTYIVLVFCVLTLWGTFNMYVNFLPSKAPAHIESVKEEKPSDTTRFILSPNINIKTEAQDVADKVAKNPLYNGIFIPLMLYFGKKIIDLLFEILESRFVKKEECDGAN